MATNQTDLILTAQRERAVIRVGTVVNVGPPLTVDVGGQNITAGRCRTYIPTVGDRVALALQDASWLVIDEIVS